ncbi:class I SAM-dependent methyltransferase [Streptomyces sp. 4N509B]|uniref:class I SAM-dependent methyltransferase n=1 Tax=Streptomyces sp. 4N509B TaxID=3457413 RepID=UPI003FCFE714
MDVERTRVAPGAARTRYVFDDDRARGEEQHRCLAAAYDPITLERLAATGVGAGWRCLDVGAGGGSVARWLAERVGPGGEVVATELTSRHLPELAELAACPTMTVLVHDVAADPLPEAAFDLVVARLVVRHVTDRVAAVKKLARALKPGGWLQLDELDAGYEPALLTPDTRSAELYRTFLRAKATAMRAGGGDPHWGRHVPAAMRAAGLVGVDPRPYVGLRRAGSPELALQLNHTHTLQDRLLAAGMTESQLRQVRELLLNPSFCATSSVLYSVQGRRPREGEAP